jgi:DNA-binding CsgD family transcriptional regulator
MDLVHRCAATAGPGAITLEARLSALIKQVYSAGDDSTAWDEIAVELLQIMGCRAGIATLIDLDTMQLLACREYIPHGAGLDSDKDGYQGRYTDDPTLRWASANRHARFADSVDILQYRANVAGDAFAHWARMRLNADRWYVGYSAPDEASPTFLLSAFFSDSSERELVLAQEVFRTVFDHIECAMRLGRASNITGSSRALLRLAVDGSIAQQSSGAEQLLARGGPLRIFEGQLVVDEAREQDQLASAIHRAFSGTSKQVSPTAVYLDRKSRRPWIAVIRPVEECYGPFGKVACQVQVEIFDKIPAVRRLDVIQSLFDLSGRELQVLRFLSEGHSIDSLSACIDVSRNTTRAHLRSIYLKTGTNSQTELMQLCAGLSTAATAEIAGPRSRLNIVN